MSRTYKHIGKGYWNNGVQDESIPEVRKYLRYCSRHNREVSFFAVRKQHIKDKIANREMRNDVECERGDICLNCVHIPRNLHNRRCAECDDGDNWEAN